MDNGGEGDARFLLLGPVEARAGGRRLDLGPPKQRTVLAILAVDAGHVVQTDTVIHRLWDGTPPPEARNALYAYVARLKRIVNPVAGGGAGVVRRSGGYSLDVHPDAVDVRRFHRLAASSSTAGRDGGTARAAVLDEALACWRGPALADLNGAWASETRHSLERQRLDVLVQWAQALLELGGDPRLIDTLERAVVEHPLDEGVTAELIRALHRVGRTAQALETYAAARRRLVRDVGTEPGPSLRGVHAAVLRGTAGETGDSPGPAGAARQEARRSWRPPAQLPADVSAFTGRAAELAALDRLLAPDAAGSSPAGSPAVVISAIAGTAGVGKTALAVRWAHRTRDRFPDGQLYVNLRGYDPGRPMSPADALAGLLTALGVTGQFIPPALDDRAALYRTELADRRMLLVLDNASSVEQVRPLLPGTPTCAVIVTSRDSLPGLVALDGARRLDLDLLSTDEAVTLLRQLIGPRVDADLAAAADLAARCARLPLAVRVAAELAASRPAASVADLVAELDSGRRLDLLDPGGDPRAAVRMVFSRSMRHLQPEAARTFALLGLHPGPDWDVLAAAALSGRPVPEAARTVDILERAHLVQSAGNGRWAMHDLLRAYATDLAAELPAEGAAALDRMFDHYVGTAAAAADLLYPADAPHRPDSDPAPGGPALDGADTARAWLDAEHAVLVAAAAHGVEHGYPASVVRLSTILFRYLMGSHLHDAVVLHGHARQAAHRCGDRAGEALALHGLGTVQMLAGDPAAVTNLRNALELFRAVGDPVGQARALANLGTLEARHGRHGPAVEHHEQAIVLYRQAGDRTGEARTLGNLGVLDQRMGSYERAAANHAQALRLFRATGDRGGEAVSLNNLGAVESRLGRDADALAHHEQSLALSTATGDRSGEAWALTALAEHATRAGRPEEALERLRRALDVFRECGERDAEPWVQNSLGEATLASGDPSTALAHHGAALELAIAADDRSQEARAHGGLARAHQALGRPDVAHAHRDQAIRRYDAIGAPEADALRREATVLLRRRT